MKDALNQILYPPIEPYKKEMLTVSELHTIYVEEAGNPNGKPVVFLHGGPGGGCADYHRRFFDPEIYRIVLFDQRGCGRSKPFAELRENTTWDLVGDLEKIRQNCGIEKWLVFGGSWGSTLGLAYAQAYPDRCTGLILRGIFTLRQQELDWFYKEGASRIFPEAWAGFVAPVKDESPENYISAYYKLLTSDDESTRIRAAKAWSIWEASTASLEHAADMIATWSGDLFAQAVARIECHYFINKGWLDTDNQLISNMAKIAHLPGVIVQGRYDVICPPETAWELHKAWPNSTLELVQIAGHAASEPEIAAKLREATDRFAHL